VRYGIFCAMPAEAKPLLARMQVCSRQQIAGRDVALGQWHGMDTAVITAGVGKVHAAAAVQLLIDRFDIRALIIAGTAGAMDPSLKIGDLVLADAMAYHDVAPGLLAQFHPQLPHIDYLPDPALCRSVRQALDKAGMSVQTGRFVTGDAFIDQQGRQHICQTFAPLCTDMESCAAAQVCALYRLPFAALRAVSDTPQRSGLATFEENCAYAADRCAQALEAVFSEFSAQSA
jgi:adenosylhomocysteine nucleosidase